MLPILSREFQQTATVYVIYNHAEYLRAQMKTISAIHYFVLGIYVRYLQENRTGFPIHGENGIVSSLEYVLNSIHELHLPVTFNALWDGGLIQLFHELDETEKESILTYEQSQRLSSLINDVRKTLEAELYEFTLYVVTPKKLDIQKLLKDIASLFAPGIVVRLSPIAQYDLEQAGKCIAYECSTAAAFHLMRATEETVRLFYHKYLPQGTATLWGPITGELRQNKLMVQPQYQKLLAQLDYIRNNFRNPTQHPEAQYTIDMVQNLWGLCADVIETIGTEL